MANKKLSAVIQIGGAVSSSLGAAFGRVRGETVKVGEAVQKLTQRERELNSELTKIGRNGARGSELRVQYAKEELGLIGKQITALKKRQSIETAQAANKTRRGELGGKIGSTVAVGAAAGFAIGAAIKQSADFDYQLQLMGNTANMTAAQIGNLRADILRTGTQVGQSTENIRKGFGVLITAGMDPALAKQFLGTIGKTATATAADVEDLSNMVVALSGNLGITPQGMPAVLDTLAQAGKEGNVELRDMAKQLPNLGSAFGALKMQGREAAATMGAALQVARRGAADADEAANNMNNFMTKVLSKDALKNAEKYFGLDLYKIVQDAQKSGGNPFEASMEAIIKATKGDQKKIGEMFGDMQVQGFLRPMIQFWGDYGRIKDKALASDGVIEQDFVKMMSTTMQKLVDMGNAFGRLGIAIGSVFSGQAGGAGEGLGGAINRLTDFVNANREVIGTTAKVVGGLFALRLGVLGVAYSYTILKGAWLASKMVWLGVTGAQILAGAGGWMRLGAAVRFAGTALAFMGRALLLNPIGLTVTAIAGAVFLIYKYWEPLTDWFGKLWEGIKIKFTAAHDWIVSKVAKVGSFFNVGPAAPAGASPPGAPAVPPMAARGGQTVHDRSQTTINVTQQPGQDSKSLVDEIMKAMRDKQRTRSRSIMFDSVGAQ